MPSTIRVSSISNLAGTGPVTFPYGATIPSGKVLTSLGNLNISGISTIGFMTAKSVNVVGVLTATTLVGNGSSLSNLPVINSGKAIAVSIIS